MGVLNDRMRGWCLLGFGAGVLLPAAYASANVGAAQGPLLDPVGVVLLAIIMLLELVVLRVAGAQLGMAIALVIIANLFSYLIGVAFSGIFRDQSLASIPGGMEWWWVVPWVLLIPAFVLTILIEWPILRLAFEEDRRNRAWGAVVIAHVISYALLALAYSPYASPSLVTDLEINKDSMALSAAGDAVLVFIGEDGFVRQAQARDTTISVPVLVNGEMVSAPAKAIKQRRFVLQTDPEGQAWIDEDPRSEREDAAGDFRIPVRLAAEPFLRDMLHGQTGDEHRKWHAFHDWRDVSAQDEWMVGTRTQRGVSVRREGNWGRRYKYEVRPFYLARFEVTHILPGDIAICSIEPGYPVAIAWRDGWIMDLREMLGARSDIVVVYGTVGDGWPEEDSDQ